LNNPLSTETFFKEKVLFIILFPRSGYDCIALGSMIGINMTFTSWVKYKQDAVIQLSSMTVRLKFL
jgi:hypothetical protein